MKTLRHNFSAGWWALTALAQVVFAVINLKGYEISLHWTGGEENLFDYILYSMDFAPFVTLAGTVSALSMMRFDGTMDEAVMFRMGNRKKYFRHKWLCSALIILAWTAVVLLLRIMAGVAAGYGIQGNPDGAGAAEAAQFAVCLAAYLLMIVWVREIARDFLTGAVLQNAVPMLFSVAELAVSKNLKYRILMFLPLGNVLTRENAYGRGFWGRMIYWAFVLYGLYYIKTEITCKRETGDA